MMHLRIPQLGAFVTDDLLLCYDSLNFYKLLILLDTPAFHDLLLYRDSLNTCELLVCLDTLTAKDLLHYDDSLTFTELLDIQDTLILANPIFSRHIKSLLNFLYDLIQ